MTRDRVTMRKMRTKALAGLAAAAILIAACSDGSPSPTPTPPAQGTPTAEVLVSVLSSPVNVPAADAQPPAPAPAGEAQPAPDVQAQAVITPDAMPIPQELPAPEAPKPAGEPTFGTFEEDLAQCEVLIGEEVPESLLKYLRCGAMSVPEQHAQPDGRQIKLPVVVLKSSSANPAPDPIVVLQGGPGGSAIRDFFFSILRAGFRAGDRDIILVDQRGSFQAQPALVCTEYREVLIKQLPQPAQDAAAIAERQAASEACYKRLQGEGINLAAYNSVENAADIAAVPAALGYTDFNLYGLSYGSLLAQHVLALHPQNVRSVVLDGVWPRNGKFTLDRNARFLSALQKVDAACQADERCAAEYPDLQNRLLKLVDALNTSPVSMTLEARLNNQRVELQSPLTGSRLLNTLFYMLYESTTLSRAPRLISLIEQQDYDYLTRLRNRYELETLDLTTFGLANSIYCSEDLNYTPDEAQQADAGLPPELAIFRSAGEMLDLCKTWQVPLVGPEINTPVTSDVPVLVLNGEFDPITPASAVSGTLAGLSRLTTVDIRGTGHGQIGPNACAASLMGNFLNSPATPLDTKCAIDLPAIEWSTQALTLQPFTDVSAGAGSVRPLGWLQFGPGLFGDDVTPALIDFKVLEGGDAIDIRPMESGALKRDDIRVANGVTWTLYSGDDNGRLTDLAVARDGQWQIRMVTTNPAQRESLYSGLFLPAIDGFIAIRAPRQTIVLSAPQGETEVTSPVEVAGTVSRTPFENNLVYRVFNSENLIISEGPVSVLGDMGAPGTFVAQVPFTVTQREAGRVEVLDIDAADGSVVAAAGVSLTLAPTNIEMQRVPVSITIESPQVNAIITSPVTVKGSISRTPFENNLVYRVFDASGAEVGVGPITTAGELGKPATFEAPIVFTPTVGGDGRIFIEDANPAGGAPFATAAIEVQLSGPAAPEASAPEASAPITPTEAVTLPAATEPAPVVTPTAEAAVPTPAPPVVAGPAPLPPATALEPTKFALNPAGIARRLTKVVAPAVAHVPDSPPLLNGLPTRIQYTFDRDTLPNYYTPLSRQMLILPLAEYRALYEGRPAEQAAFDKLVADMKNLLATRPPTVTEEIPFLPQVGAAQALKARLAYLDFEGGACVRFIAAYRQDVSPFTDADTFYTCQGLSTDGQYWVSFTTPIASTALPANFDRVPAAVLKDVEADYAGYVARTVAAIERLNVRNFRPFLNRIDNVVKSLTIEP
jgi:pimeloyl-ACP methyl ester carboxylesterase